LRAGIEAAAGIFDVEDGSGANEDFLSGAFRQFTNDFDGADRSWVIPRWECRPWRRPQRRCALRVETMRGRRERSDFFDSTANFLLVHLRFLFESSGASTSDARAAIHIRSTSLTRDSSRRQDGSGVESPVAATAFDDHCRSWPVEEPFR